MHAAGAFLNSDHSRTLSLVQLGMVCLRLILECCCFLSLDQEGIKVGGPRLPMRNYRISVHFDSPSHVRDV